MKILITGANGFIGKNLSAHLKELGHEVIGIDNFSNSKFAVDVIQMNVNSDTFSAFVETQQPDVVVHLAAMGSIQRCKENKVECFLNNVVGFNNVFLSVLKNKVPLFLYASSSSIYPEIEDTETRNELLQVFPDSTMSLYGGTKVINEMVGRLGNEHMDVKSIGLRFFNVFGPHQRVDVSYPAFIPKVVHAVLKRAPIDLYNEGKNSRDFTPVKYVCRVIERLINKYKSFGEPVLNIGYGQSKSCVDIIARLEKLTGKEALVKFLPSRSNEIEVSQAHTELLNLLEVQKYDFDSALADTILWNMKEYSL